MAKAGKKIHAAKHRKKVEEHVARTAEATKASAIKRAKVKHQFAKEYRPKILKLRNQGLTHEEIAAKLDIGKTTACVLANDKPRKKRSKLTPQVIKFIVESWDSQSKTSPEIADYLNNVMRVKTTTDKDWTDSEVCRWYRQIKGAPRAAPPAMEDLRSKPVVEKFRYE